MTYSKVSVLVPTRGRVARLRAMCDSFNKTASGCSELVFRVDDDDTSSWNFLRLAPWTVKIGPRLDGYRSLPHFFNELRLAADGDVLMTGNDDMVFRTRGWDAMMLEEANRYPDGLFDLGVETHNARNFPFAVISRWATDAMGFVHDARLFWGDVFLRDVMQAFDRSVPLVGVRVDHDWAGHAPDETFRDAHQEEPRWWDDTYWGMHRKCVGEAVEKLRKAKAA